MVKISTMGAYKIHTKPVRAGNGRLKTTEPTVRGRTRDTRDASLVPSPSVGQPRREKLPVRIMKSKQSPGLVNPVWVPVISSTGIPLMPCRSAYARALLKKGRAIRRWYRGIFCIRLLDRVEGVVQQIAVGIDPGLKREGMTVQSKQHTYLNILSDAVTQVSKRLLERKYLRRSRRYRKTPCRICKNNRKVKTNCPIRNRWLIKINILNFLRKIYPITDYVVEDIKAKNFKNRKRWNLRFSPLEMGKTWFYVQISKMGNVIKKSGYDTFRQRTILKFEKVTNKLSEKFNAHNVDSWVLASFVTGKSAVDNKKIFRIIPIQLYRRKLHLLEPGKNGVRKPYGGTLSLGLKRGSVMIHKKLGIIYIGGTTKNKITLHDLSNGERISRKAHVKDLKFLYYNNWRTYYVS